MNEFFNNIEELVTGWVFGFIFLLPFMLDRVISLIYISVLFAILWRLGGSGYKWVRRYVMPVVLLGFIFWFTKTPYLLVTIPIWVLALSLGYGIPSINDSGSTLGKFVYNLVGKKDTLATFVTRAIIGLLMSLGYLSMIWVNPGAYTFSAIAWPLLFGLVNSLDIKQ